jgi:hypothetical protein
MVLKEGAVLRLRGVEDEGGRRDEGAKQGWERARGRGEPAGARRKRGKEGRWSIKRRRQSEAEEGKKTGKREGKRAMERRTNMRRGGWLQAVSVSGPVCCCSRSLLMRRMRSSKNASGPVPLLRAVGERYRRRLANHGREPDRPRSFSGHVASNRYLACIFPQSARHKLQPAMARGNR